MSDLEEVRKRWVLERGEYEQFGKELVDRLTARLRLEGLWFQSSSRAKETDSLIRKLIAKPRHSYESLGDKCGARIIVRYKSEIHAVLMAAKEIFECGETEDKVDTLPPDKVGYLSTHVDLRLYGSDAKAAQFPPARFSAELQVRTLAQHLWSEMSHDTVYKNDETLIRLSNEFKRRVFVLAGTIELADNEFTRLGGDMPQTPEVEVLKALQKHFYKLTARPADVELSLCSISWLYPLYKIRPQQIAAHLDDVWPRYSNMLQDAYDKAETDPVGRGAFFYQPEALMVYDLLQTKEWAIRAAWAEHYPEKELERLADVIGISFTDG
jgi:ppGpp synthetase/RelA/SpoT-type nucleotidyltranferase